MQYQAINMKVSSLLGRSFANHSNTYVWLKHLFETESQNTIFVDLMNPFIWKCIYPFPTNTKLMFINYGHLNRNVIVTFLSHHLHWKKKLNKKWKKKKQFRFHFQLHWPFFSDDFEKENTINNKTIKNKIKTEK